MSGYRKQRSKPQKDKANPQFQLKYTNPKSFDKIRFRSGATAQREMCERDRWKMMQDQRKSRNTSHSPRRVTSSSDAMDTDDTRKHTRSHSTSPVGRGPIKAFPLPGSWDNETDEEDDTVVDTHSDKTVVERKTEGPLPLKEIAAKEQPHRSLTRMTYRISVSLDTEDHPLEETR